MRARFRIRTPEGKEMVPETLEIFSDMVRSGVLRPGDLVFDALTGEWAPAEVHPMVLLCRDPLVLDPALPEFDLVDPPRASPEEEAQAFIARMEAERRDEAHPPAALQGSRDGSGPVVVAGFSDVPAAGRGGREDPDLPRDAGPRAQPARPRPPGRNGGSGLSVILVGVAVLAVAGLRTWAGAAGGDDGDTSVLMGANPVGSGDAPGLAASEEEIRRVALRGFLAGVDGVREETGLGEVPAIWLEGSYLSDAASHPDVPRYWERARRYVEAVRRREMELYREAYLAAAGESGLAGPVRSLRMASAMEDFLGDAAFRYDRYRRMLDLCDAALALHGVLIELGDRVTWEPMRGERVSADPVLEAAGTDPDAQALLEVALDRVLEALHDPEGGDMGDRSRVSGWLVEGLGAALTPD
jgi:hypothetical protein